MKRTVKKTNEKYGKGKKKGLTPHHLKKQIFPSSLYYTVHPEELEQMLQDLNAELSKAGKVPSSFDVYA